MKKIGLTLLVIVAGISSLKAQRLYEKAIGFRVGTMVGASYKQFFHTDGAFEAILDLDITQTSKMSLRGTFVYEYHFPIKAVDGLSWYLGPGVTIGGEIGGDSKFLFGVDFIGGAEYKFATIPLCLALDFDPKFFITGYDEDFKPLNIGLTLRYTF